MNPRSAGCETWGTRIVQLLVGEPDVTEFYATIGGAAGPGGDGVRGGDDLWSLVEELEDALGGGHGGLQDVEFVRELEDGAEEALRVLDEGDQDAEGDGREDAPQPDVAGGDAEVVDDGDASAPEDEGDGEARRGTRRWGSRGRRQRWRRSRRACFLWLTAEKSS